MSTIAKHIAESIAGKETAQRWLYERYRVKWYVLCQRYAKDRSEADDIFQEGLISVFRDLHQYDESRAGFSTWSCKVIAHAALRYLRKQNKKALIIELDDARDVVDNNETIYDQIAMKELVNMLQSLPTGYRIVFNMYVLEGYSHNEIADTLNITSGTSRSQLAKAKKMLQRKLEYQFNEYAPK